jgi:CMP-N-acetylneuraminic acid synthetase
MTSILAVTLARGGSKGVPGKHTRDLCGKPVIAWTIEEVLKSGLVDAYVVSSDDDDILNIASEYDEVKPLERPKELAKDTTPTLPALLHAVNEYDPQGIFDYVVEVRATSPLKTHEDIDGAIRLLVDRDAESVIGMTEMQDHHPARAKWLDKKGVIHDFIPEPESGRRQDCKPKAYIRNGTIYALRTPIERLFGHEISLGYVMDAERSVNIDTEIDFKLCEILMRERLGLE